MAAPFSRLQLAAALIEYDNDLSNPDSPHNVSAHTSAIFAPLRGNRRTAASRKSDYLGVALPTDTSSVNPRDTDARLSRNSIQTFGKNPFGQDSEDEEHLDDDPVQVDLSSWGLDAFMPKEKPEKKKKPKERTLPTSSRSMSLGNYDQFGLAGPFLETQTAASGSQINRRRSVGAPLDFQPATIAPRRASFHVLSEPIPPAEDIPNFPTTQAIPFPRSQTPPAFERRRSTASIDSKILLQDRPRVLSSATILSQEFPQDNPFALQPPEHSRASRFDPKVMAHARTMSNATMGSRVLNDAASVFTTGEQQLRERRLSTLELLRPKVLVMPSPLQGVVPPSSTQQPFRDGFHLSTDGTPLPPGARTSRRLSATLPVIEPVLATAEPPIASNSFTPNPRLNLSLSQLTFRQLSHMGGERDVAYSDLDLRRATEDGEQVQEIPEPEPEIVQDVVPVIEEVHGRPAGKLFGRSLINDLEMRKAQMRNRQRVFAGDQRPSMMDRQRSSTLIDPATLHPRPVSQLDPSTGLSRRNSGSAKPLLTFDIESQTQGPKLSPDPRVLSSRSVFGTDKLWEREMIKLREIEAQEKLDAEKQELIRLENEKRKNKKKKKKGKKNQETVPEEIVPVSNVNIATERVSIEPPTLPAIERAIRGPPPQIDDIEESESEGSGHNRNPTGPTQLWHSGSEDERSEDDTPAPARAVPQIVAGKYDSGSEDDLPLAAAISRTLHRSISKGGSSSSDDERPLSTFLRPKANNASDDDEPLGLRASKLIPSGDDDDRPLAFHPEQQRRSQFFMAQQQQQQMQQAQIMQQQQMMMQAAQMQNNMLFATGSGFFNQPPAMIMQPPMLAPSPPPSQDAGKFGLVDKWRRDISSDS